MGNKIYKYIIITEILLILAIFTPALLSKVNVALPASVESYSNVALHNIATLTMPFGWLYELDRFTNIPMQNRNGDQFDMFVTPLVFLLCSSMWCGIIFVLVNIIRKKQPATPGVSKGAFWQKIFFSNLLISLVALGFLLLLDRHHREYDSGGYFLHYMGALVLTMIFSLLLATAWWLAEKLWLRTRVVSLLIACTAVIAGIAVIFLAIDLLNESNAIQGAYSDPASEATSRAIDDAAKQATMALDSITAANEPAHPAVGGPVGEEYMTGAADYILHQQLKVDSSMEKQQTYELADKWHDFVYPLYAPHGGNPRMTLAYAKDQGLDALIDQMNYTGRSGSRLQESFTMYKHLLWERLPFKVYQTSLARYYVEKLLQTYTVLQAEGAPATRLKKLYTQMADTTVYHETESFIGDIIPLVGNLNRIDPALNNNNLNAQRTAVWLVSFWARRYHEGNQAEVHDILKSIQVMYDGK